MLCLLTVKQFHPNSQVSKEEQLQQRQESLEKRICELENSLEKGKKSNSSQRKTPNADKEEITTEMYITVQFIIVIYSIYYIILFSAYSIVY